MSELGMLEVAAAGMDRERLRLDLAARNAALAQTDDHGAAYGRLVATFTPPGDDGEANADDEATATGGARVVRTREPLDALTELVAALDAQRAYESDASLFEAGKRLAERTLEIERS